MSVPAGDVLLHAGDFTNVGEPEQVQDLHDWLVEQPHTFKIVIAGNHDITMDADYYTKQGAARFHRSLFNRGEMHDPQTVRRILTESRDVIYLEDAMFEIPVPSCINNGSPSANSIKVWGSPYQPEFCNWAFNLPRGEATRQKALEVPTETDILLTHGPPLGRGDRCSSGGRAGCIDLLREVQTRVKPSVHVFGHIHEGYGVSSDGQTLFVNASSCNLDYRNVQPAIVLDIEVLPDGSISSATVVGDIHAPSA
jgi:predicted phosphodiesterase